MFFQILQKHHLKFLNFQLSRHEYLLLLLFSQDQTSENSRVRWIPTVSMEDLGTCKFKNNINSDSFLLYIPFLYHVTVKFYLNMSIFIEHLLIHNIIFRVFNVYETHMN